jgi:sarcosine oxidase subunit gamma
MADILTRRSRYRVGEPRFASMPTSASLAEEPFVAMVDLWVDAAGQPGGAAAPTARGVDTLPATPSTAVSGRDSTVIWFGPQEWLITSARSCGEELEATLREAVVRARRRSRRRLRPAHHSRPSGCTCPGRHRDRAARWTCTRRYSDPGAAAQTTLGQAGVVLIQLSDNGTRLPNHRGARSFAGYLADWLIDAAEEFGVDW